jgi:hypothetical protein
VRAVVIQADHPEVDRALREGKDELTTDGEPISIRPHLTMHEVLANRSPVSAARSATHRAAGCASRRLR